MKRIAIALLTTALFFAAHPAAAQQCTKDDTPLKCWQRFNPPPADAPAIAADAAQTTVAAANTGVLSLTSPAGSALKDFLTLLSASLESSSLDTNQQAFTFDWNPRTKILGVDPPFKFQAVFRDPLLSGKLTELLAENAAAVKTLDSSLQPTDDIALSASVDRNDQNFGRSIAPHRDYFESWYLALIPSDNAAATGARAAAILSSGLAEDEPFTAAAADRQAIVMEAVESAARSFKARRENLGDFAEAFTKLLNNQKQLYVSAVHNSRRNIVGPNEWTGKLTFEWGPQNLNSFESSHSDCTPERVAANAAKCLTALKAFAAGAAKDRVALSVEYHRQNQRWIDLPAQSVAYGIPSSHTLVGSLTYGRPLTSAIATSGARLDVKLEYEDNTDKKIDNRFTGSAIVTYKINDAVSVPLGFVFSNHETDLPDSDRQIGAHFGLVYKLPNLPSFR